MINETKSCNISNLKKQNFEDTPTVFAAILCRIPFSSEWESDSKGRIYLRKKEKAILIGKTIKRMRDLKGLTQGDLAFDSDLERSYLVSRANFSKEVVEQFS